MAEQIPKPKEAVKEAPKPKEAPKVKKLGSINGKPILCTQKCTKCPFDMGKVGVRVAYIKDVNDKVIDIKCKDYKTE